MDEIQVVVLERDGQQPGAGGGQHDRLGVHLQVADDGQQQVEQQNGGEQRDGDAEQLGEEAGPRR